MSDVIIMNIGMFDKDTKQQELSDAEFLETIYNHTDCTITHTAGIYTHEDGTRVVEPSIKVEIYDKSYLECCEIAHKLCKELNQECIVVNKLIVDRCDFISNE